MTPVQRVRRSDVRFGQPDVGSIGPVEPPTPIVAGAPSGVFEMPARVERDTLAPSASEEDVLVPATRSELLCRVLNVLVAGIALLLLAPLCVLVAFVVKLTSRGPVFYTQTRVGLDRRWARARALNERRVEDLGGQPFTILKFR